MNKLHLGYAFAAVLAGCNSGGTNQGAGDGGGDGGSGTYSRRLDLPVGAMPQSLAVTDVDGDQRPDVLVARATGNGALTLISANSAGVVNASLLNASIGDTPYALAVGDFDGDGMVDAAVANFLGGNVTALFGQSFVTKASFGDGAHPIALAVGYRNFERLLAGAHDMDEHFFDAPADANLPLQRLASQFLNCVSVFHRVQSVKNDLMPRTAWAMRCSFSTSAKRT